VSPSSCRASLSEETSDAKKNVLDVARMVALFRAESLTQTRTLFGTARHICSKGVAEEEPHVRSGIK